MGVELFHVDGRTDGHDEANSRFSQYYERALKKGVNSKLNDNPPIEFYIEQTFYLVTF